MNVSEMKKAISEKIDQLNEGQLKEVNNFLNKINNAPAKEWDLTEHINDIVKEREAVLKKLAK